MVLEVGEEEVGEEAPSLTTGGDEAQGQKKRPDSKTVVERK